MMPTDAPLLIEETHYLVLDLEATCALKNKQIPRTQRETIEIGAVMVNATSLCMEGEFQQFIRPVLHPQLTPYCLELTAITQADVDGASSFADGLTKLQRWGNRFGSYCLCAWGEYDRQQLQRDCDRHSLDYPFGDRYLNLRTAFARQQRTGHMGLSAALAQMNLTFDGQAHRGIDDARNTARLLIQLRLSSD